MLDNLTNRLSGVIKTLRGQARLTESNIQDTLREVRMALLEADVALPVVKEFIAQVKQAALGQEVIGNLNPGQALIGVVVEQWPGADATHYDARGYQIAFGALLAAQVMSALWYFVLGRRRADA